jgi:hypothetical protein
MNHKIKNGLDKDKKLLAFIKSGRSIFVLPLLKAKAAKMKKKFDRKKTSSIYWKNKADDFHAAALVLNEAIENNNSPQIQQRLGEGFNLYVATSHTFEYLAAVSIELNLKSMHN